MDLIGPYSKSKRKQDPGGAIIWDNASLTLMTMIDPATGWFEIVEIPMFDLDEVTACNDKYIYKSFARVRKLFNNTWLCKYQYALKFVFDKGSEFKRDFNTFLKEFDIKPILTSIRTPQDNICLLPRILISRYLTI